MNKSCIALCLSVIVIGMIASSSFAAGGITVTSSAFSAGGPIPPQFTCKGANRNPPLHIDGLPSATETVVLIVDDPDAPGGLFTHWLVWNIKNSTTDIPSGGSPGGGKEGTNGFGKTGYGGPCPPSGTHRYFFRVFALNQALNLSPGSKRAALDQAMQGHVIASGELMGRFAK